MKRPLTLMFLLASILVMGSWGAKASALTMSEQYYQRHPLMADTLEKTWGAPVAVQDLENGLQKRVYKVRNPYPETLSYRYFIVKDGRVVSSGLSDTVGVEKMAESGGTTTLPVSQISQSYYARYPMKAEEVKKTWGKPVLTILLDPGIEQWVFEIHNPYPAQLKYRYFTFKDGMVLASGVTDIIGTEKEAATCSSDGPPVAQLSKLYYGKVTLKADELAKTWGQPVLVQKLDNGMENRVYRIRNPYPEQFKYRYFLISNGRVVASGVSETVACDIGVQ